MGNKIVISIVILVLAYLANTYWNKPVVKSPIVEIQTGKLQGLITTTRDGRDILSYLGIPYSKPPIGILRFEPPEPLTEKWEGVRDATTPGSICIQADLFSLSKKGNEDCLFINVHTPTLTDKKVNVLVWLHGGMFSFGSGSDYMPYYLLDEDVVLVTANYRLGSFGFLNSGDGLIRGNQGLKDQNLALRWVKENIGQFGGNPHDVTIFGESAGGASVHYQMLSSLSKGLFHKAISQSGMATIPWAINRSPTKQAHRFAKQLNCPVDDSKEMVKCLKSRSADDIVTIHMEMANPLRPINAVFLPTIEREISDGKAFLAEDPAKIIETGRFNKVPFLTGINEAEGLVFSAPLMTNKTVFSNLKQDWAKILPPLIFMSEETDSKILEKVKNFYIDGNGNLDVEDPFKHFKNLTNICSDFIWKHGFHKGVTGHLKHASSSNPIFIYYYTYQGDFRLADILLALRGEYHPIIEILGMKISTWFRKMIGQDIPSYGACHADELTMLFEVTGAAGTPKDSNDYSFSKNIVKLWVSFAKSDPKTLKSLEFMGQKWAAQEPNKPLKYMELGVSSKMIPEPDQERLAFWDNIKF